MGLTYEGLVRLKEEIDNDPENRNYASCSGNAGCIRSLLVEPISQNPPVYTYYEINPQEVINTLIRIAPPEWDTVVDVSTNGTGAAQKRAFYFTELMKLDQIDVGFEDADLKSLVQDMVDDGTLSEAARDALRDLSRDEILQSRSSYLFGFEVDIQDVVNALAL